MPQRGCGFVAPTLSRLRGRSLAEFRVRGLQALRARLERLQVTGSAGRPSRYRTVPLEFLDDNWFAAFRRPASAHIVCAAVARRDPVTALRLRELSDGLERGEVPLLGHGLLAVGNPPRWDTEPLSGRRAPSKHWSLIDHLDTAVVGDHKLLWELNRHQYLFAPAFCWALDRDARRFELICSHLESWLAENPRSLGVNWVSSLEVAYRAISWCWLLWLLRDAPWKPELKARLGASLADHASHIEHYLSTYYSPNTHLTGEALGLFYVGTVLRPWPPADRWRAQGAMILEACLDRQVRADGVYFEQASQYHRYTTEIYLHYQLLGESSGWTVSPGIRAGLGRLCDVLRGASSGRGRIPLLGDDDGGLVLPVDHRPADDVRALLLAAAVTLGRPELAVDCESPPTLAYWLCGVERTDWMIGSLGAQPEWTDMLFASGGIAVLRDGWDTADSVAVIDAGPHGSLSSAHSHADAMAMTLTLGSTELFIDRGTLTYTGPERNEFRSTMSHNTLEVDAESSATPGTPFRWLDVPPTPSAGVFAAGGFSGFAGESRGHVGSGRPSAHARLVLHQRGGAWVVHDRASRSGARGATVRWQLAPGLDAELRDDGETVVVRDPAGVGIAVVFAPLAADLRVVVRGVSQRLGHRVPAQCLEMDLKASLDALTIVVPMSAGRAVPTLRRVTYQGASCFSWGDAHGCHQVTVAPAGSGEGVLTADIAEADLLWWADRSVGSNSKTFHADLLAALALHAGQPANSAQPVTDPPPYSGKMTVLAETDGTWARLAGEEPRRGGE